MVLKFFGRDSGFGDEHTSSYFSTENEELVIIDCSISTLQKLKHMDLSKYKEIYVLITHTHGDHICGLGLFVQYAYFVFKKHIVIGTPSRAVAADIETVLTIEGNDTSWYELITGEELKEKEWFIDCVLTQHSPQLEGKCFGYNLVVDNTNVVYTGDTSTLKPFLPYLTDCSELYVDTSVYYGMIHLKLEDALSDFMEFTKKGIKVYLMHIDDVIAAEKIVEGIPNIEVVSLD